MDKTERERDLLAYADGLPGNPVRQLEAYEELQDSFQNKETLALLQGLKNESRENLTEIISGITDQSTLQEFAQEVIGTEPEDLKIVLEVEQSVSTPDILGTQQSQIEQKIEEIKTIVEQEIIEQLPDEGTKIIDQLEEQVESALTPGSNVSPIPQETTSEETLLEETIAEVQEEIFSSPVSVPSTVEESLPEAVQQEIAQIKEEVPAEQALEVEVTSEKTVTNESIQTPSEIEITTSTQTQTTTTTPTVPGL